MDLLSYGPQNWGNPDLMRRMREDPSVFVVVAGRSLVCYVPALAVASGYGLLLCSDDLAGGPGVTGTL